MLYIWMYVYLHILVFIYKKNYKEMLQVLQFLAQDNT